MLPFEMDAGLTKPLIDFLRANRHGERYLVAAASSMEVAPIIIETGEAAISLGGFMGADPVVTKDQFARMVDTGQVRFVMIAPGPGSGGPGGPRVGPGGGMPFPPGGPGGPGNSEVTGWVREHGKVVDTKLWRPDEPDDGPSPEADAGPGGPPGAPFGGPMAMFGRMRRMTRLYDCKPDLGLVTPPAR
jgi:4-amino-4-deoxy-L-arabinose transferase-like glycosyltransferase